MDTGLLINLGATTAVQTIIGTGLALIMKRYVAAVDRVTERVRVLEEKRIAELERANEANRTEHGQFSSQMSERMSRSDQRDLVARIEKISDEQHSTAIQQATVVAQMHMATSQIDELFGRIAVLQTTQARMQGKIDKG